MKIFFKWANTSHETFKEKSDEKRSVGAIDPLIDSVFKIFKYT